jgi:hypothetical protein
LRAVELLLGHTKIESTVRYLGIEVDDALAIAEQVNVWNTWAERTRSAGLSVAGSCQFLTFGARSSPETRVLMRLFPRG